MGIIAGLSVTSLEAEQALAALLRTGFRAEDFSLVASDRRSSRSGNEGQETALAVVPSGSEAAAPRATVEDDLGNLADQVVGLGELKIPGIGPALAAGPMSADLAGGSTGGLVGALVDAGIPAAEASAYQEGVVCGGILVMVNVPAAREEEVRILLLQNGLHDVSRPRGPWVDDPSFRHDADVDPREKPHPAALPR